MLRVGRKNDLRKKRLQCRIMADNAQETSPNIVPVRFSSATDHTFFSLYSSVGDIALHGRCHVADRGFIHVDKHVRTLMQRLKNAPPNPLQIRVSLRQECACKHWDGSGHAHLQLVREPFAGNALALTRPLQAHPHSWTTEALILAADSS